MVLIDPPPSEALEVLARTGPPHGFATSSAAASTSAGYLHLCWAPAEVELSERLLAREWELAGPIGEIWQALGEPGERPRPPGFARSSRAPRLRPHPRGRRSLPARAGRARALRVDGPIAAPPPCGSYPRRGRIWSDRGPTGPASPDTRRQSDSSEAEHNRADRDAERRGQGAPRGRAPRSHPGRRAGRAAPTPRADSITRELTSAQRALLGDLFAVIEEHKSDGAEPIDRQEIERAFAFACESHAGQERKSGEDFITHPLGVARICAGLRLDTATLCAALLHDTVEDTSASLDQVREGFGDEVAQLVDGVTKLTEITFKSRDERQAENYRKMMVAMATDVRVILIKLADRLHNMRTIGAAAEAEAAGEGARDARDLRPARPPPRDPRDQVGARGPRLRDAPPAQVRRDQGARRPAAGRARALRRGGRRSSSPRSSLRSASTPRSQAAPSTSIRSTRR